MAQVSDIGQLDLSTFAQGIQSFAQGAQNLIQTGANAVQDPLAAALKSVTFYTNYSPEKTYTGAQLSQMMRDPSPSVYGKLIQPTIVLDTAFGQKILAPYGKADVGIWKAKVAQAVLLTGSVLLLGGVGVYVWGRSVGRRGG